MQNTESVDGIAQRINGMALRISKMQADELYFYNMPITEIHGSAEVVVNGRQMLMFASYGYSGLLGHPRINAAAKDAIDRYGTGTHGVRLLAGTLDLHRELEATIAKFKGADDAITFSSGYVTNLAVISCLVGRHDLVLCDKFDHASILDGCVLAGAELKRFRHNDMAHLEALLQKNAHRATKLVIVDSVFSMDGDIIDLPTTIALCRKYKAYLMVDEAHSIGVLGATGRGIEEHFGMHDGVDVKMGTLSKTIPSVGGYAAGSCTLVNLLRHAARGYIFSAALPPAQAAAARAAFDVILDEPERVVRLRENSIMFRDSLKRMGYDTMQSETAIVPVLCGADDLAYSLVRACQQRGVFALPVVAPAVPEGTARLRATVTAGHSKMQIEAALEVFEAAGKEVGLI